MNIDTKTHEQNFSKLNCYNKYIWFIPECKLYYSNQCDYLLQREYGIENIWLSQKRIKFIWLNYHFLKNTQHTRYGSILSLLDISTKHYITLNVEIFSCLNEVYKDT